MFRGKFNVDTDNSFKGGIQGVVDGSVFDMTKVNSVCISTC